MLNCRDRSVFKAICKELMISVTILVFLSAICSGQEQKEQAPPIKERLFYGGSFALMLGTATTIELSPVIGLWVLPRIDVAIGPTYRFYKYRSDQTDIYGGKIYTEFVFFRDMDRFIPLGIHTSLFLHIEDEMLSLSSKYWANVILSPKRFMINTVLVGPGLSQQMGKRASFNLTVLWALNDSGYPVYSNPEVKIGFVF